MPPDRGRAVSVEAGVFRGRFEIHETLCHGGGSLRFNFETWLIQTYGLRVQSLNKRELTLAKKEYAEEYPPLGESEITLKTYPFKKYLDSKRNKC